MEGLPARRTLASQNSKLQPLFRVQLECHAYDGGGKQENPEIHNVGQREVYKVMHCDPDWRARHHVGFHRPWKSVVCSNLQCSRFYFLSALSGRPAAAWHSLFDVPRARTAYEPPISFQRSFFLNTIESCKLDTDLHTYGTIGNSLLLSLTHPHPK